MLYLTTLAPATLDLLRRIQSQDAFKDTRLVGGAALALHYGHRTSLDLDLFGSWRPQPPLELVLAGCASHVMKVGGEESLQFFTVEDVKIDCVTYPYKWLRPAVESDGIRLADVPDIAAMKLAAVTNRGTRKDFVDVYFLDNNFLEDSNKYYNLDVYTHKHVHRSVISQSTPNPIFVPSHHHIRIFDNILRNNLNHLIDIPYHKFVAHNGRYMCLLF